MAGVPTACLSGCASVNTSKSPNGDAGVDAMMSVIAHELAEAVSDPISDIDNERAWQDSNGSENADKCAWGYGTTYKTSNGASANGKINGKDYLIQRNWDPVLGSCQSSA
jgi:Phosphate-induced protein 1 conserved region